MKGMREGAKFVSQKGIRNLNLNYIVKRLEVCADKYNDCKNCPELILCRTNYDERCGVVRRKGGVVQQ